MTVLAALAIGTADVAAQGRVTGSVRGVTVTAGMTLRSIGARTGTDPSVIAAESGIRLNAPLRIGTVLRIDNRHIVPAGLEAGALVINVPQRILFYQAGAAAAAIPVAVGRSSWQTPLGPFSVTTKEVDPTWEVPISIQLEARRSGKSLPTVVPPGPANPLGKHWLGLSIASVGIHGTNAPSSIYQTATHGCVRLHPDDIAWLYEQVHVGTPGRFVYEPVQLAVDEGDVFLEVAADVYRRGPPDVLAFVQALAAQLGVEQSIDWIRAQQVMKERAGIARRVTRGWSSK